MEPAKQRCNICGKEFDLWDEQEDFCIDRHVGYGSHYDGMHINLHMCCDCFDHFADDLSEVCKIPFVEPERAYDDHYVPDMNRFMQDVAERLSTLENKVRLMEECKIAG